MLKADLSQLQLIETFLQTYPREAANILEHHPVTESAELLALVEPNSLALVFDHMFPQYTAKLCEILNKDLAAKLLSALDYKVATTILRLVLPEKCFELLEKLPTKQKFRCSLLLKYSFLVVGGWIEPSATTLLYDYSALEAKNNILKNSGIDDYGLIFTLDYSGKIYGSISIRRLFELADNSCITAITKPAKNALLANSKLASVESNYGWNYADILPVVDENRVFVGTLSHLNMRKGLNSMRAKLNVSSNLLQNPEEVDNASHSGIYAAYMNSIFTLFEVTDNFLKDDSKF